MLYCPKCQVTYEDGTQRFCTNEGARLLPYAAEKSGQSPKGVFSSILSKSSPKKEGSVLPQTESVEKKSRSSAFLPPSQSKFFKGGKTEEEPVEESKPPVEETAEPKDEPVRRKSFEALPLARIINPSLIPEKQTQSDQIFSAGTEKITAKKRSLIDFSEVKEKDILQSFEAENEDLLEVIETEDLTSGAENADPDHTEDAPFNLKEPSQTEDEFELNLEKNESGFPGSDSEFNLDLELDEISGADSGYEIDFDERAEPVDLAAQNPEIELEIDELDYISVASEPAPKFELDLDEIEDAPFSASLSPRVELDPASRQEINLADSIPKIELDLAELEEISVPAEFEAAEQSAELPVSKEESETVAEEISAEPEIVDEPVKEEKAETRTKDSENQENSKAAAASHAAAGTSKIKATEDTAWEKRSIDPPGEEESRWFLYPLVGIILLVLGLLGFFYLTSQDNTNSNVPANIQTENSNLPVINNSNANTEIITPNENTAPADENTTGDQPTEPTTELIEVPPAPRTINPPPNTVYFKNEKKSQKRKLADKFLGFSIYYPKTWKVNNSDDKFLDISLTTPDGAIIKQLIIEPYDSKGTFLADKALFKDLVEKSDKDLRTIFFRNYQVIFEGESIFQNGRWNVYEVSFRGVGGDKNMTTWGRRLWIPVQRPGMKSGFIVTMIGTSNSKDVRSVDDLGEKDDLAEILKTFEPELN